MIIGVDHVQLAAPEGCEAQARQFYGALLGLEELPKPELLAARGGVWFRIGGQQLHIGVETPFAPAAKAHPGLRVAPDAIDDMDSRFAASGVPPIWDDAIPGVRRFYVNDPWGNRLELLS